MSRSFAGAISTTAVVALLSACAQPQPSRVDPTLAADLAVGRTVDLGVAGDLATSAPPPDFSGVDLAGADLSQPPAGGDMAMACDLVKQTGCGANEKCTWDGFENSCVSLGANAKATGAVCNDNPDDCAAGDLCVTVGTVKLCHQLCNSDSDCKQTPPSGGVPARCVGGVMGLTTKLCTVSCNPYQAMSGNNGCPTGLSCGYGASATQEIADCDVFGSGGDGVTCQPNMANSCKPGFTCATISGAMTTTACRQICQAGMNGECAALGTGYSCVSFGVPSPVYGVCAP
jgi:hypothetical protein